MTLKAFENKVLFSGPTVFNTVQNSLDFLNRPFNSQFNWHLFDKKLLED